MPTIRIIKTEVDKLVPPEAGRVDYFDTDVKGFGVRVAANGNKTFFAMCRVNGRLVRTKIESADKITVQEARKRAKGILADMGRGLDLNEEKRKSRQKAQEERRQSITLREALEQYLNKGNLKPRTLTTYREIIRLYLGDWLEHPAQNITRGMVLDRHREIAGGKRQRRKLNKVAGVPVEAAARREAAADNCMRTLRAILNYAFEDEESKTAYRNPVDILSSRKHKAWFKPARRQTVVKNSDLPAWYRAVEGLENNIMRDYLLFVLFTGLRRREAATLQWRQVDFNERCFTVVDTKNGDPHTLPLSSFLWSLLYERKKGLSAEVDAAKAAATSVANAPLKDRQAMFNRVALAESRLASVFVFPGEGRTGHLTEPKRAIDAVTAATGITFTMHDLRRTFATVAESLDLSGYTIKALLNHRQQLNDVTGGYIILDIDRLRDPMQRITDAILERTKRKYGEVVQLSAVTAGK